MVSYCKFDTENNMKYITEEEALAAEAASKEMTTKAISDQDTLEDSYMRLFFMAQHQGNGEYKFSTDARWLTMPTFRDTDSLGSIAQICTVTPDTESAYMTYDYLEVNSVGDIVESLNDEYTTLYEIDTASSGAFYGAAVVFDLPNDYEGGPYSMMLRQYSDVKVHFEYEGKLQTTTIPQNFNTNGSYSHSYVTIGVNPGVSIDLGGIHPSIGINAVIDQERRTVPLEINYTP